MVSGLVQKHREGGAHLHLLLAVLGGVLAALALPAQLLQFGLALLQTLPFTLMFQLVFLQGSLRGGNRQSTSTILGPQIKKPG